MHVPYNLKYISTNPKLIALTVRNQQNTMMGGFNTFLSVTDKADKKIEWRYVYKQDS